MLTPRPWTVAQSTWAAELIAEAPPGPVLEVCAGAGHIGLLAVHRSGRPLVAVDANPTACDYIRRNAVANGLDVDVREGRMDEVLAPDERFAVVIADPPWVPTQEVGMFPDDPVSAIDGGLDGTALVRTCLAVIDRHLSPAGSAVLQVGPEQADAVDGLLSAHEGLRVGARRSFPRGTLVRLDRA